MEKTAIIHGIVAAGDRMEKAILILGGGKIQAILDPGADPSRL